MRFHVRFGTLVLAMMLTQTGIAESHLLEPLATDTDATHRAVLSGVWSDTATWGGSPPDGDARVVIPSGIVVTVDGSFSEPLFWIRVDGTLRFAPDADTSLTVDTVFVAHGGRFEMGTEGDPVRAGNKARLLVRARNGSPIDQSWDRGELSRGLIAEGSVEIHGTDKTAWTPISSMPAAGSDVIVLDDAPMGWSAGDVIVLTASNYGEDETFTIVDVNGPSVRLDRGISFERQVPRPNLALHVANLTRNVQIASEYAGDRKLQGHMMLMGGGHRIRYAGFYDLGRTTIKPVSDPRVLSDGTRDPSLAPVCGLVDENVRGRYAVHFHMATPFSEQSVVEGSVVTVARNSGFKIGFINHSSNVSFRRNVGYQIDGSTFFTEEGDEVGEFVENLAIYSKGSNSPDDSLPGIPCMKKNYLDIFNRRRADLGHRGHGFWIHGGGVNLVGNVASAHGSSDFELFTRPLSHALLNTYVVRFPVSLLPDGGTWTGSYETIPIEFVPVTWRDNVAYVTGDGKYARKAALSIHYHALHQWKTFPGAPKNLMSGFQSWNTRNGVVTSYSGWADFHNFELVAGTYPRGATLGMGLATQGGNHMDLTNVFMYGFTVPLKYGSATTCLNVVASGVSMSCDLTQISSQPGTEPGADPDPATRDDTDGPPEDAEEPPPPPGRDSEQSPHSRH